MELPMNSHEVEHFISEFDVLTRNPEIFTEVHNDKSKTFSQLVEEIYKMTVASNFVSKLEAKSLPHLLVEGFDNEQIWQQIEIQNKSALSYFSDIVPAIKSDEISFSIRPEKVSRELSSVLVESSEVESQDGEDYAFDDDSDSSSEIIKLAQKRAEENIRNTDAEEEDVFDKDYNSDSSDVYVSDHRSSSFDRSTLSYKSKIDDQFFKLSKLEEFLKIEDLKEEKKEQNIDDNDDDIDMFQDIPSDGERFDDTSDDERKRKKSSRDLMYEDFFDAPESGDERIEQDIVDEEQESNNFENMSDDGNSLLEQDVLVMQTKSSSRKTENVQDAVDNNIKTTFEIEQEKIRQKIQECEKNMLDPVPWHLTGEVAAASRPKDSLIDHETDFDSIAKHDLIIDSDLTEKVENIIKMAIINKAFCDVERKIKPTEDVITQKKENVVDQVKSKKSLAEVYEEDYLKKQSKEEEQENPKHKEIKMLMDSLFPELYALFSHIPKPAIPEIKMISNLPAVTVEEVAPTSVSDATLLAPEEVKKKSGLVKGKTERTDTDRKRERRKKKIHQRLKEKKKQEKLAQTDPSAKLSKHQKSDVLKKLTQNKNTKIADVDGGGKIKSSKDFFSRLHETVNSKPNKRLTSVDKKRET